jgi:hypothetical protein
MARLFSIKKLVNNLSFVIPAEAGIQTPSPVSSTGQALRKQGTIEEIDSRFHGKPWIPHQVRNDRNKDTSQGITN